MRDVLYVPNLPHNVLSVGQLVKVYFVNFENEECVVLDKKTNKILVNVKMAKSNVFHSLCHKMKK